MKESVMMSPIGKIVTSPCRRTIGINFIMRGGCVFFSTSCNRMYDKTRYSPDYYRYKISLDSKKSFSYLLSLSESKKKHLEYVQMEYEVLKATGEHKLPDKISFSMWIDILEAEELESRLQLYRYFLSEQNDLLELERQNSAVNLEMSAYTSAVQEAGYTDRTMMLVDSQCVNDRQQAQNISSDLCWVDFGRDIVIDFGIFSRSETNPKNNVFKQLNNLRLVLEMNRKHKQSLRIHIANCGQMKKASSKSKVLFDRIKEDFPLVTYHEGHIFNEFDKERLVYISPWENHDFQENPDQIPILFFDDALKKHKLYVDELMSNDIKRAKLPVHQYIRFSDPVGYFFSLVENVSVLQDIYLHHDWLQAFTDNMLLPSNKYNYKNDILLEKSYFKSICMKNFCDILQNLRNENATERSIK